MTHNIIELLGIITITIGIAFNLMSAPEEAEATFVKPTSGVTVEGNFCSQGGMLPASVKPCDLQ